LLQEEHELTIMAVISKGKISNLFIVFMF
jgi:hypothetical protein